MQRSQLISRANSGRIVGNPERETTRECIAVTYSGFVDDLSVGADVLLDDIELELRVIDKDENTLYCEVCNDATLGSRKSVNVPGSTFLHFRKDRNNILYAIEKDIDFCCQFICSQPSGVFWTYVKSWTGLTAT